MFGVQFKAGDSGTLKNAMPVDLYFPDDWGHKTDWDTMVHFAQAGKVYQVMLFDNEHIPYFREMVEAYSPALARKGAIDFDELEAEMNDFTIKRKLFSKTETAPLIDYRGKALDKKKLFKDTSKIDYDVVKVKDVNAIFGGSHDIGTGNTYTTVTSWWSDWGDLTSNIEGVLTSNTTETTTTFFCFTVSHDGFTSTLTSDTSHDGSPVKGWKVQINMSGQFCAVYESGGSGDMIWEDFSLVRTGNAGSDGNYAFDVDSSTDMDSITLRNMFFDGGGYTGSTIRMHGTTDQIMNRSVIWDTATAIIIGGGTGTKTYKNLGITDCTTGFEANGATTTITNTSVIGNTTEFANIGSATVTYSRSGSTLAGATNEENLTFADEFEDDDTQDNFFEPLSTGVCDDQGTDPVDFSVDMAGEDISSVFPNGPKRIPPTGGAALSGTNNISVTSSGNLTGKASLSGSNNISLTASGNLEAKSSLSGTNSISLTASGNLTTGASAALSGTNAISLTSSGDLKGTSSLSGTNSISVTASGNLSIDSASALSGTNNISLTSSGNLSGQLSLSGTNSISLTASGNLSGPTESTSGGTTKSAVYKKKKKKKWTEEELKGLEDYGKAMMGIEDETEVSPVEKVETDIAPETEVSPIDEGISLLDSIAPETEVSLVQNIAPTLPEISILEKGIEKPVEEIDELLIITMIELHLS